MDDDIPGSFTLSIETLMFETVTIKTLKSDLHYSFTVTANLIALTLGRAVHLSVLCSR